MTRLIGLMLLLTMLSSCGFETVSEGYRGIETRFGKVVGEPLAPGLHFYNPFTSDVFEMDVREYKLQGITECFTRDTQTVNVTYAITIYPMQDKIGGLYSQFGTDWASKIVEPELYGALKDTIGQVIADDLVSKREVAKKSAETDLKEKLKARGIILTSLNLIDLQFDDAYEKAVEEKVVAIQRAAEAKNKTVQVEEQAKQVVLTAKADAEAMRIKSQALSQNKGLVQYEAIQKWDGKLPAQMFGNAVPIINLDKLGKE